MTRLMRAIGLGGIVRDINLGFTLLELLTAMAVMVILVGMAPPFFQPQGPAGQLSAPASRLYSDIQQARIDALRLGSDALNVYFFAEENWCYRITDRSDQECSGCDGLCDIAADGKIHGLGRAEFPLVALVEVTYRGNEMGIQRRRGGLAAGHDLFRAGSQQLMLRSSGYGRLRICSPEATSVAGAAPC